MKQVLHISSVHARTDTRIRIKETMTLARELDANVIFLVQDGQGDEIDKANGVQIVDTGERPKGRWARMTKGTWRMYRAVKKARPDIVHFHDPELIPIGLLLRMSSTKVVYDVHEDLPRQVFSKSYIPEWLRKPVSIGVEIVEKLASIGMNGIVVATPKIAEHFPGTKTLIICNYPLATEFANPFAVPHLERPPDIIYVGGITPIRGTIAMVKAMEWVETPDARLQLFGSFSSASHQKDCEGLNGWKKVAFHGWCNREEIKQAMGRARAGLVVLQPVINYIDALPVKMFEYMAAGLPVIASDFPLWRRIVEGASCGLLVDPEDPNAIAQAVDWILAHPQEAREMGRHGRKAIEEEYNWNAEADKLVNFYHKKLGIPLRVP